MKRWFTWLWRKIKSKPLPIPEEGLPDNLNKENEELSGYTMSNVRVHYDSSKPAQLDDNPSTKPSEPLKFNQGSEIHPSQKSEHLEHQKSPEIDRNTENESGKD